MGGPTRPTMEDDNLSLNSKYLRIWRCLHTSSPSRCPNRVVHVGFPVNHVWKPSIEAPVVSTLRVVIYRPRVRNLLFCQAIRNLVCIGVSGRRRTIDIVSSEYANLAPQSQHTLYVSASSVKTLLMLPWWQPNRKSRIATSLAKDAPSISLGPSGRELNFIRKSAGGLPIGIFA